MNYIFNFFSLVLLKKASLYNFQCNAFSFLLIGQSLSTHLSAANWNLLSSQEFYLTFSPYFTYQYPLSITCLPKTIFLARLLQFESARNEVNRKEEEGQEMRTQTHSINVSYSTHKAVTDQKLMIACQMCMFINIFLAPWTGPLRRTPEPNNFGCWLSHLDDLAFDQWLCWLLETCVHAIKHSKCQLYFGSKPAKHATLPESFRVSGMR